MATWFSIFSILLAAAALFYALRLQQENDKLRARLDRYNKTLFTVENEVRAMRDDLAEASAQLRAELMTRTGTARFTPEMTARTASLLHPQVDQILAGFHLGGCSDCAIEPDETLAQICEERGIAVDTLLGNLNMLVADSSVPQGNGAANGAPKLVKLPNISFEV